MYDVSYVSDLTKGKNKELNWIELNWIAERHPITPKLIIIITTYFKSTIDNVDSAVDSLIVLPEDGPVRPKHVAHKHTMYIFSGI
jgi:hypothetical protein